MFVVAIAGMAMIGLPAKTKVEKMGADDESGGRYKQPQFQGREELLKNEKQQSGNEYAKRQLFVVMSLPSME